MAGKQNRVFELEAVGGGHFHAEWPRIVLVHGGRQSYLWIGNGPQSNQDCYAVLSDAKKLRELAKAILAELGE